jgi:hypothetical protein
MISEQPEPFKQYTLVLQQTIRIRCARSDTLFLLASAQLTDDRISWVGRELVHATANINANITKSLCDAAIYRRVVFRLCRSKQCQLSNRRDAWEHLSISSHE